MEEVEVIDGFEIPEGKKAFKLEGLQDPIRDVSNLFANTDINVLQINDVWYAIVNVNVSTI